MLSLFKPIPFFPKNINKVGTFKTENVCDKLWTVSEISTLKYPRKCTHEKMYAELSIEHIISEKLIISIQSKI